METEGKKLAECSPLWGLDRLSSRQPAAFSPPFARRSVSLVFLSRPSSSRHNVIYADEQGEVAQKAKRRLCSVSHSPLFCPFAFSLCLSLSLASSPSRSFAGALHSMAVREFSLRDDFSEEIQTPFRESWRTAKSTRWPPLRWFRSDTYARHDRHIYTRDAYSGLYSGEYISHIS